MTCESIKEKKKKMETEWERKAKVPIRILQDGNTVSLFFIKLIMNITITNPDDSVILMHRNFNRKFTPFDICFVLLFTFVVEMDNQYH